MKHLLWLLLFASAAHAVNNPCPQTVGSLTTTPTSPRLSGVSPLLVFFDNSGVASTNVLVNSTAYQDVNSSWDFGDRLGSGTATWRYGSNPNVNQRTFATGNNAAHLFVTEGRDTFYTVNVDSNDGVNDVKCAMSVHVFDPSGASGWPGAQTTCLFNTTVGSGCPAGATQTVASTFAAINASLSNKRLLYKCGDNFTGGNFTISGTKWSVGAYGTCVNTQTGRPTFTSTSGGNPVVKVANTAVDGRFSDIVIAGAGIASNGIQMDMNVLSTTVPQTQITFYNTTINGTTAGAGSFQQATQIGVVDSDWHGKVGSGQIAVYFNVSENNCVNASGALNCGGTPNYIVADYIAVLGSDFEGTGGSGGNVETFRVSAGSKSVYSNSTFNNAISQAANFKFHSGNTYQSCAPWIGQTTQFVWISDNSFGTSGGPFEVAPQNGSVDEHIKNVVVERVIGNSPPVTSGGKGAQVSGQNITVRDSAFQLQTVGANYVQNAMQVGSRGACQLSGNCSAPSGTCTTGETGAPLFPPNGQEYFNISVYSPTGHGAGSTVAVQNDTSGSWGAPAQNSHIQNIMLYAGTSTGTAVTNTGSGNTVDHNTANAATNPGFTNGSGNFSLISDFKPTISGGYIGGTTVPVRFDALNVLWPPTWDLGAVHH